MGYIELVFREKVIIYMYIVVVNLRLFYKEVY